MRDLTQEAYQEVALITQGAEIALQRALPEKRRPSVRKPLLWFRMFGVGLFFPKRANITGFLKELIVEKVKRGRPGCATVIVLNRRSRSSKLTCCDEGMVAVDVYYPKRGAYSTKEYLADPSFVCTHCLTHKDPCDYDPLMF